jgi:hypothetical protein
LCGRNDEYMDINYVIKTQSIIEFQAQGELKSSSSVNPVRTAGVVIHLALVGLAEAQQIRVARSPTVHYAHPTQKKAQSS